MLERMNMFILFTVFINYSLVFSKELPKEFLKCGSKADCTAINEDCCGRGKWVIVNKHSSGKASSLFCPKYPGVCPEVIGPAPPSDSQIQCINQVCNLIKMPKGDTWGQIINSRDLIAADKKIKMYPSKNLLNDDLISAIQFIKDPAMLELLLKSGFDPNHLKVRTYLWTAIQNKNQSAIELLRKYGAKLESPHEVLLVAILEKDANKVKDLIAHNNEVVAFIKGSGPVNEQNGNYRMARPLHFAAKNGTPEIIELLVKAGALINDDLEADINHLNRFYTPLVAAARGDNLNTLNKLISLGAKVNDKKGAFISNSNWFSDSIKNEIKKHLQCKSVLGTNGSKHEECK